MLPVQGYLLAAAVVSLVAGLIVGVSDNLPGILLVYLATIAVILAFAVRFRTPRQYELLLLYSVVGFVLTGILHGVFEAAASVAVHPWLRASGEAVGVVFFFVTVFFCPAGFVVGLVGCIATRFRRGDGQLATQ